MSYLIRRVLAKPRLILDEMCRLYGKLRLIFRRINGPIIAYVAMTPFTEEEPRHLPSHQN